MLRLGPQLAEKELMTGRKPLLQALVLADYVYSDKTTGKKIICGTFNRIWGSDFPTQFGRSTFAYFSLTEIQGEVEISLRWVDLATSQVLMHTKQLKIKSSSPLATVELAAEIPGFPMPHPGDFAFEVHWQGQMLGSHRVAVAKRQGEKHHG